MCPTGGRCQHEPLENPLSKGGPEMESKLNLGGQERSARGRHKLSGQGSNKFPDIPSLQDTTFAILIIEGPSKDLAHQLNKLCITLGRIGGGADFEFHEPEATDVHCIVAAYKDGVRLYEAACRSGIYVNDQRISTVELKHLSTFCVGSSLLLVTILQSNHADFG